MNQNEEVTLVAQRCQHGVWHSHNALVLPDGSTVDDPEGPCPGGTVCDWADTDQTCTAMDYLVIPVSDGGSET